MDNSYITRSAVMRIISFATGCAVTVTGFCVSNLGASEEVSLQAPESTYAIVNSEFEFEDDMLLNAKNLPEPGDDFPEELTFTLTDEPVSGIVYDGTYYFTNSREVKIRDKADINADVVKTVGSGLKVLRVASIDDWSLIRLEDGTEGYCYTTHLVEASLATPTPTPSPTSTPSPTATPKPANNSSSSRPTSTPKPTNTPKPTKAPVTGDGEVIVSEATSTPTPTPTKAPDSGVSEVDCNKTVYATTTVNIRKGPGTGYTSVKKVTAGTKIVVVAQTSNGWYRTDAGYYVSAQYTTDKSPTATPTVSAKHDTSLPFPDYVKSFLGVPYVYAQSSATACDCSGLVKYVYSKYYGINLPHGANSMLSHGTSISPSEVQCGDLVFFDYNKDNRVDHVGIFIGSNTVIHASESRGKVIASTYSAMTGVYCARRVLK
ncbi:Cell wall-associated hydrolase, NlpC family [Ruminococcaceae bacterium YRB3002]|nr:Cell wall-associated hydrolase, NlpC family [Ruminococcaceae bacterium YRB3002]